MLVSFTKKEGGRREINQSKCRAPQETDQNTSKPHMFIYLTDMMPAISVQDFFFKMCPSKLYVRCRTGCTIFYHVALELLYIAVATTTITFIFNRKYNSSARVANDRLPSVIIRNRAANAYTRPCNGQDYCSNRDGEGMGAGVVEKVRGEKIQCFDLMATVTEHPIQRP